VTHRPLRVAVVGIDGAGKSSTTLRAIAALAGVGVICKPGRDPFVQQGAERRPWLPRTSAVIERTFRGADATKRRLPIGLSRLAFIHYQGWLEPAMERRHRPALVISTRCMIIDPSIYSVVYAPALARYGLEQKLELFRRVSRLPFRDLYVFLKTPAEVAMHRIAARIAKLPGYDREARDYWLHLHEREPVLRGLGEAFAQALAEARRLAAFDLVEIDTTRASEEGVAEEIADLVRRRLACA